MAIQMEATVFDLEESELCYAPQFGAAKDPVNMAGMIASNVLRGDLEIANWHQLSDANHYLLDVRTIKEYDSSSIDNAIHIPMEQLRDRIHELPRDKEIWTICGVGQRAYYATRLLMQHDIKAKLLSGGMATYQVIKLSTAIQ
jgi:rhodanese-related sulfurtransferase